MATLLSAFTPLPDRELLDAVQRLAADERHATAALIASLAELDARRLYLGEGCSSLFTFCTQVLHLSEHAAYGRIEAARVARRFPTVLDRLAEGAVTLTAVGLLAPHLTADNHVALLDAARHKAKREVEQIVAALRPQTAVPSSIRKLPQPRRDVAERAQSQLISPAPSTQSTPDAGPAASVGLSVPSAPRRPPVVHPLAPERYKVQFTADTQTFALMRRAQDLMRHRVPDGDVGAIVAHALQLLVDRLEHEKLANTARPRAARDTRPGSRTIPAAVRRQVWARDAGRCAFVGTCGRCTETGFLEFHHVRPYADGGAASVANIELRCRAHNQYEAELFFTRVPPAARERVDLQDWIT